MLLLAVPPPVFADELSGELPKSVRDILDEGGTDLSDTARWRFSDLCDTVGAWAAEGLQPALHLAAQSAGYLLLAGLLGLRPVWYYRNGYLPYGMKASIAGMAGPVIWLVGLAALLGLLWHQVSGRGSRQGAGVLILYGTQLIPWMLVTRCTFLYHYFPSSMFCLAALALVLARMKHVDWAKKIAAGLCVVALVLFVLYYPALSGLPIPAWWADALNVLPSFGFY